MTDSPALVKALKAQVLLLEEDMRGRVASDEATNTTWRAEHRRLVEAERTGSGWLQWRDDRLTQAAVAWVLTSVFVRFCEDNALVGPVWIAGPAGRRQEALDAQLNFFRGHPDQTDREWLLEAIGHLREFPATAPLVDDHSPLWSVSPSGQAVTDLLAFWRAKDDAGELLFDFADPDWSTRFLGDLYQDLSEHAKKTFALLQTPDFVEEFILDQTLEPALAERPLEGFSLIDPTCGSGHFLLGAFRRLLDRWDKQAPGLERQTRVQKALDAVHGVDLNPFAVAIARFRLTVEALRACGLTSLEHAPAFDYHVAAGDSLRFGRVQRALFETSGDDEAMARATHSTEDLAQLNEILEPGQYDVVVGNPPYITVKDKKDNQAYRARYETCKGTYALTVPFMERFFELAKERKGDRPAGWVGQITSNSFMKREFGSKLIEQFLIKRDLRLVADTSGAYIPGHGTPTVVITGRHQSPVGSTVRAVLGIRGEPGRPERAENGLVWTSIVENVSEPGYQDKWISVTDLERNRLESHPWSLSGGSSQSLLSRLSRASKTTLRSTRGDFGFMAVTREDDAFALGPSVLRRAGVDSRFRRSMVGGAGVRDWCVVESQVVLCPYSDQGEAQINDGALRLLWPLKAHLLNRRALSGLQTEIGREWWEFSQLSARRYRAIRIISFAFVSTHNHFVLDRDNRIFIRTAPVIKLPTGATEDDHLGLLGVLNSSTACFWLKQNSHDKGNGGIGGGIASTEWERFYEFTGTTLQDFPLPAILPLDRARDLDRLATEMATASPHRVCRDGAPTDEAMREARRRSVSLRGQMIAAQEELDWAVYGLYGLPGGDLTYTDDDLPELRLGERTFEIALARQVATGEEETAWFDRHGSTPITEIPDDWPEAYRRLVQQRLDLIASDPGVALLESPEHKRRWASEPWEKQQEHALRDWLLDQLEDRKFWFGGPTPAPRSIAQLADEVGRDANVTSVLALWEGRPDVPVVQSLTKLLTDEVVPFLAAYRLKESGLSKREAWEETWDLQRKEDAGVRVGLIPVPPKYTNADFKKASWWQARGKLDVPKERFILYPNAGRTTDGSLLLGWAGWDHAEQSLALASIIGEREAEGRADEDLVPLVAGLAELQPWVEQWHADIHPAYGQSLAVFCREQLAERSRQVGLSTDQLAAWRPPATTRRRKATV